MLIPNQSRPISRQTHISYGLSQRGLAPAQGCAGVPSGIVGSCFEASGPIPGKFNCAACCALRGAIHWQGGGHAVAC